MAAAKYSFEESGEADRPMKVCAEAGRKCVRNIHQYPILSHEWLSLVDSLKQLTRLVQLEGRMPVNTKVSESQGRNQDSDGTLWDQEAHENAIRILVEEAKVNLCLRMMTDYKKWQYNTAEKQESMQRALKEFDYTSTQLEQKCDQYEASLGVLLWRAFAHVETLQLMDIPLLIDHCALVLDYCSKHSEAPLGNLKLQETLVLFYVSYLHKHAEKLNSNELLARSKEYRLIQHVNSHVLAHIAEFSMDMLLEVAEGFSALADNEDFRTNWADFLPADEAQGRSQFLELELRLVTPILSEQPERKKDLRPLLDFFKEIQRKM